MSSLTSTSLEMAIEAYHAGNTAEAFAIAEVGLNADPNDPNLNQLSAILMLQAGHVEAAILRLETAYRFAPDNPDLILNYAQALITSGRLPLAASILEHGIQIAPSHSVIPLRAGELAELMDDLGAAERFARTAFANDAASIEAAGLLIRVLQARGAYDEASNILDRIAADQPDLPQLLLVQAKQALALGQIEKAADILDRSIAQGTTDATIYFLRGNLFLEAENFEEALSAYGKVLELEPNHGSAYFNAGHANLRLGKEEEAVQSYQRAYTADPSNVEALFNVGTIANSLSYFDLGVDVLTAVLEQEPNHQAARNNRAHAYRKLSLFQEALADYEALVHLEPTNAKTYYNLGVTWVELKDFNRALLNFEQALALDPDYLDALVARGLALYELVRYAEALASFDRALELSPTFGDARLNRGHLRRLTNDFVGAIEDYKNVIDQDLPYKYVLGDLLYCKMQICDWNGLDTLYRTIEHGIRDNQKVATPFSLLSYTQSAEIQKLCAEIYCQSEFPPRTDIDPPDLPSAKERIRIAYFSADFHDHATMHLMAGLFEEHDRSKFEVYAFSFGPVRKDAMRSRAESAFDHFIEASELSDKAIALLARHFEIDIAIDLKGFTTHSRAGVFSYRAAPIQINFLGYPGTMGAKFIDYIIADEVVIPPGYEVFYTEKVIRLPVCYQVNDSNRVRPDIAFSREQLGLPENAFVFCGFNNNFKITPEIFEVWCRLLQKTEDSVLWLLADNRAAADNLRREAAARGIDPDRLVFAPRVRPEHHLARHAAADLFLDCFPCAAHTTASDALFAGLPLITLIGDTFASRVAASLLKSVGLSELIAQNLEEYEEKALFFTRNADLSQTLKDVLGRTIMHTTLYNTAHFARSFEDRLVELYRHERGL